MLSLVRADRFRYVTFVVSTAIFIVVIVHFYHHDWNVRRTIYVRISESKEKIVEKKILLWNNLFAGQDFHSTSGDHCENYTRPCWSTHDMRNVSVEDFDAVLIHANDIRDIDDFPKIRKQSQKYVYVNSESAGNTIIQYEKMKKDFFNLTMTYRLDSDVFLPYENVRDLRNKIIVAPALNPEWKTYDDGATEIRNPRTNVWKKTKSAVWFVSHCETNSKRENYVAELQRHIDVAIIGACGEERACTRNRNCFREIVEPNYHFYLSFENSLCKDYVSEKLYNALRHDVVPVVYGGANYTRFAPPGSYINALDFDSPELLANYLKSLIQRPDEYERFFDWKRHYEIVVCQRRSICELCRYLHDDVTTKSYSQLDLWWKTDQCPLQDKLMNLPYMTKQNLND